MKKACHCLSGNQHAFLRHVILFLNENALIEKPVRERALAPHRAAPFHAELDGLRPVKTFEGLESSSGIQKAIGAANRRPL